MAIKIGDKPILDIIVNYKPVRKVIVFEEEIVLIPDAIKLPKSYITLDVNDENMIYPPIEPTVSGWNTSVEITNTIITNKTLKQISFNANFTVIIYDVTGSHPSISETGVYWKAGNDTSWSGVYGLTPIGIGNNYFRATYNTTINRTLTQSEWDAYFIAEYEESVFHEKIVYEENGIWEWQPYTNSTGYYDFYVQNYEELISNHPPTKIYENKIVELVNVPNNNEYNIWSGMGIPDQRHWEPVNEQPYTYSAHSGTNFPDSSFLPAPTTVPFGTVGKVENITGMPAYYKMTDSATIIKNYNEVFYEGANLDVIFGDPNSYAPGAVARVVRDRSDIQEGVIWYYYFKVIRITETVGNIYYKCVRIN